MVSDIDFGLGVLLTGCYSLPVKFPKQRQEMTTHVVAALQDKSSSVRRYAIALLTRLILTHPFGLLHGGPLNMTEWEGRYEVVAKELKELESGMGMAATPEREGEGEEEEEGKEGKAKKDEEGEEEDAAAEEGAEEEEEEGEGEGEGAEDEDPREEDDDDDDENGKRRQRPNSNKKAKPVKKEEQQRKKKPRQSLPVDLAAAVTEEQALAALDAEKHVKLKLTKKYVADALAFIRQIEGATDVLSQLLVSTSKAEVLESMEFFKTAHEYQLDCAEVRVGPSKRSAAVNLNLV